MPNKADTDTWKWGSWIIIAVVSMAWWVIAGKGSLDRSVLLAWLSLASFVAGSLIGFLFSSYGEESNTVGKIRDWLVGGLTALTVANATMIKNVVKYFALNPENNIEFAFTIGAAIVYSGLGFYFMFFQRELILNVLLARSRAERERVGGTQEAGEVVRKLLIRLPANLVSGSVEISEIPSVNEKNKDLKELLYSENVETFLKDAEQALGTDSVDWDVVSKAAYLTFYRVFFNKEDRKTAINLALRWIVRALNINPLHIDLTMKYAYLIGNAEPQSAVAILERLSNQPMAPMIIKQWLGSMLRSLPDRLDEAIAVSAEYHKLFPEESDTFFNIANAYGQKYRKQLQEKNTTTLPESNNRQSVLSNLREGLAKQPELLEVVRNWTEPGRAFDVLLHDKEFRVLVGLPAEAAVGTAA